MLRGSGQKVTTLQMQQGLTKMGCIVAQPSVQEAENIVESSCRAALRLATQRLEMYGEDAMAAQSLLKGGKKKEKKAGLCH